MSSEKKEYSTAGAGTPSAPNYANVLGTASAQSVNMTSPYAVYPGAHYTSAYLPSSAPTYLPANFGAPLAHIPYGTVSVAPNVTAYGVPQTYVPSVTPLYSPHPGTVYIPAAYDAGARFDGHAMPVVPPPPPGIAPNAAQLALLQGNSVVLGQQKNSFLSGGGGAGYTHW